MTRRERRVRLREARACSTTPSETPSACSSAMSRAALTFRRGEAGCESVNIYIYMYIVYRSYRLLFIYGFILRDFPLLHTVCIYIPLESRLL